LGQKTPRPLGNFSVGIAQDQQSRIANCKDEQFKLPLRQKRHGLADVLLKHAVAVRMAQFAQCLRFDLADAFAGDVEQLANFF
jgi:hypothetical protein